jgi:hypothetical protein
MDRPGANRQPRRAATVAVTAIAEFRHRASVAWGIGDLS